MKIYAKSNLNKIIRVTRKQIGDSLIYYSVTYMRMDTVYLQNKEYTDKNVPKNVLDFISNNQSIQHSEFVDRYSRNVIVDCWELDNA